MVRVDVTVDRVARGEARAGAAGGAMSWRRCALVSLALAGAVLGAGCDQLGIETPQKAAERQAVESKAIGSACRHAMRAIEDCYTLNPQADKAAVFGGWREMDEYMRENKLDGIAPVVPRPPPAVASAPKAAASKAKAASRPKADEEDGEEVLDETEDEAPPSKGRKGKAGA